VRPSEVLYRNRDKVRAICAHEGLRNIRVFGSIARQEDVLDSDIDLLFDAEPEISVLSVSRAQLNLSELLGYSVDLVEARCVPFRKLAILDEAVPL